MKFTVTIKVTITFNEINLKKNQTINSSIHVNAKAVNENNGSPDYF